MDNQDKSSDSNEKHFLRFAIVSEYAFEIENYISDDDAIEKFKSGFYDDVNAQKRGKDSVVSITVDNVFTS